MSNIIMSNINYVMILLIKVITPNSYYNIIFSIFYLYADTFISFLINFIVFYLHLYRDIGAGDD